MGACGLTPGYTGHAFWDSDTWIFPALLLLHPERAKSLAVFRAHTLPAAQARAKERGLKGAMYPWEADPLFCSCAQRASNPRQCGRRDCTVAVLARDA